jgi:ferredoxin
MEEIELTIDGKVIKAEKGKNLYDVFNEHKIPLRSSCGGYGKCGECVIKITEGKEHLPALTLEENQYLGNVFYITKERLCCRLPVEGKLSIELIKKD